MPGARRTPAVSRHSSAKNGWIQKAIFEGRVQKVETELKLSTNRLRDPETALAVARQVVKLEHGMTTGMERAHLREMARRTSIRGTDVRLLLGDNQAESPYPAYRWMWHEVLAYAWKE